MTELARLASEAVDSEPITPADYGKAADEALQAGRTEAAKRFIELAYLVADMPGMLRAEATHRHRIH